jgi:small subunit ribosomal protein S6
MSKVRQYELIYITAPEVTDEVLAELHAQVVSIVERFGGTVSKSENWGRKRLAYEIAGQREGVYVMETIDGPGELTAELDRRLRVTDAVVRHLIVRVDEDLAVAERAAANRKSSMATRRIKRGLPPEPTDAERRRHREDSDDDDVMGDAGFTPSGDRGDRGERGERGDR